MSRNFTQTSLRRGYDEREVDEFLDRGRDPALLRAGRSARSAGAGSPGTARIRRTGRAGRPLAARGPAALRPATHLGLGYCACRREGHIG